jgi:uncharacterized protein
VAKVDFDPSLNPYISPYAAPKPRSGAATQGSGSSGVDKKRRVGFLSIFGQKETEEASEAEGAEALPRDEATQTALLDQVFGLGDDLKKDPSQANILAYREAVGRFVKYVVKYGYDTQETSSGTNILKRKKFLLVKVIDQKLDQLAASLLLNQRAQLDILSRVEEIYGLLVDLTR